MINEDVDKFAAITAKPTVEVLNSVERRRKWTAEEKQRLLEESEQPGSSVSLVARKYGLSTSQLFSWRKQFQRGGQVAIRSNDDVVPANDLRAAQARIRELERQLGRKTMESEILKEAISIAKEKNCCRGRNCKKRTIFSISCSKGAWCFQVSLVRAGEAIGGQRRPPAHQLLRSGTYTND